ncbi:MAG: YbaN family protein [Candidatus Poseidoniales archaeon]
MTSEGFFEIVRRAGWGNGMTNDVNVEMPHSHYAELSDDEIVEVVLSEHKPSSNPIVRFVWTSCGLIFVVFAAIGLILPGWPTTSWLVAAGFCFGRSSQNLFRWLLTNRLFGVYLLNYYKSGKTLPLHSKIVICGLITIVSIISIVGLTKAGDPGFGQTTIALVALIGVWWVGWHVPTTA